VLHAHVYPASPKIPILLFIIENVAGEEDRFVGILDVASVATNEEDLRFLGTEIRKVTERYGEDYVALRQKGENMYKLDQWEKAANAGLGIFLGFAKDQFDLIKEAGLHWLSSYFSIVKNRENESYDKEDVALRDAVRARILEYCLIEEGSVKISLKLGIPLEAMTLGLLAPTIRY
jgi:coproporphyrinogen III oxidase